MEKPATDQTEKTKSKYVKKCTVFDKHEGRYLHLEPRSFLTVRRLENAYWYSTNQSNDVYVPYYNFKYTMFETIPPNRMPSHPRERHRCDFHLSDLYSSLWDKKASRWGCFVQLLKCFQSEVGEEPERLRTEYWING
eukprot:TRINITY_DN5979_c0_g1_i1.p1 TRINITY_DN5979_c0_g1~~TRINITY_DN5979_c0_g1_i1.p1  ORF type:complete len:137 (+),score=13.87 TRINITY_DN5979_c0_g1_i1:504-914(+)